MALVGKITDIGLSKSVEAANNDGWYIYPRTFAVSELQGALDASRTENDTLLEWYAGNISSVSIIDNNTLQFNCNIPANVDTVQKFIKELYIYAEDNLAQPFLLALAQPTAELVYDPDGELRLRLQIKIANLDLVNLYQFNYTQATEIEDHNLDVNAHPPLQNAMKQAGIFTQSGQRTYNGQHFDQFPAKAISVFNKAAVWYDTVNARYDLAVVNGGDEQNAVGIYDSNKDVVVFHGILDFPHSLNPYVDLFLSDVVPGSFTNQTSNVKIGFTLPNNKIFVQPGLNVQSNVSVVDPDGDTFVNLVPPVIKELTLKDANDVLWDVKVDDDGVLYTEPNSLREADLVFRMQKADLSFAQITIDTAGVLVVNSPPLDPLAFVDPYYYIESPNGTAWKFSVNLDNTITMIAHKNIFLIQSETTNHFAVKQTANDKALTYTQVFDVTTLPATPDEIIGLLPFCFYDNGSTKRMIWFDSIAWRYVHDNSLI